MRLVRIGAVGSEQPAVLDADGNPRDVSQVVGDFNAEFFASGGMQRLRGLDLDALPVLSGDLRVGAPIARPGNLVAVGLNYADHAREAKMEIPTEPVLFNKAPNTVIGPFDDIYFPRGGTKVDWEVELGSVIGSTCRWIPRRRHFPALPASWRSTTYPRERSKQSVVASGSRGRHSRRPAPRDLGSSRPMIRRFRSTSICGST